MTQPPAPKAFISYAWSSPEHQSWVLKLSEELVQQGVDVILDRWGLREGHDKFEFMEKMVTDPSVGKVIIVCDRVYKEKANQRSGGVGTETQILTPQLYGGQKKDKFCAVLAEHDDEGNAYLPAYYESRLYIDLSDDELYAQNFEQLVRWVYDRPVHERPPLGVRPAYLSEVPTPTLGSSVALRRALDAIKTHKATASGAVQEYFDTVTKNLDRFRANDNGNPFDEAIIRSIEDFKASRDEIIQVFAAIAQYSPTDELLRLVHRFFESLTQYFFRPPTVNSYNEYDYDNFKFIGRELFLYWVGLLLKHDKLELLSAFLTLQYYVPRNSEVGRNTMVGYTIFNQQLQTFDLRNRRLDLRRISLEAETLNLRNKDSGLEFRYITQADFILFIRQEISEQRDSERWYPDTLIYREDRGALEVFARSGSKSYFDRAKQLLAVPGKADLVSLLKSYSEQKRDLPRFDHRRIDPADLMAFDQLATRP